MKNTGFTLIEVLIFTSLISFIFITLSYITVNSIHNSKIAAHKVLATHYAEELREVLRNDKEEDWKNFTSQASLQPNTCYGPIAVNGVVVTQDCGVDPKCVNQCNTATFVVGNAPDAIFKRYANTNNIVDANNIVYQVIVAITVEWNDGGKKFSVPLNTLFAQNQ